MPDYLYFDLRQLKETTACNEAMAQEVLQSFTLHFPGLLTTARKSLSGRDVKNLQQCFHQIKASLGLLSRNTLYEEAVAVEQSLVNIHHRRVLLNTYVVLQKMEVLIKEAQQVSIGQTSLQKIYE